MWRQFHGCPGSGGGIEGVFTAAGKQHDALKKSTMDKTLENTWKVGRNTKMPTYDDKGVFNDDEGLSGTSGLASNPANREIASSSGRLSTKTFFFSIFFNFFFLKKLEKI